jgi:hypothetical protein
METLGTKARALFKSSRIKEVHAQVLPTTFYCSCPIFEKMSLHRRDSQPFKPRLCCKDRVDYKDILQTRLKNIIYSIDQFSVHALRLSKWS